jgi:aspartyl/asparaginyl beta-hydroxylase (cupin superfamily)
LAAKQGQLELADSLYAALAEHAATRLEAIGFLAYHRFLQERYDESCRYAAEALALRGNDRARINLALSQYGASDLAGAEATLLQLDDPDMGHAPLLRGALQHRRGDDRQALASFESYLSRDASASPDHSRLPPLLVQLFALAKQVCAAALRVCHQRMLDELLAVHGATELQRVRRAIEHFHGNTEPWQHELQRPSFFYVPGLPPEPWFERARFSWVVEFERHADAIYAEYRQLVANRGRRLKPYITAGQNAPRESWGHLIETDNWLSLHLLKGGTRVEPNASDMPVTMAALQSLDLPDCVGNSPEAFFSTLAPGTHIPPHHGLANFKLTAHLALHVPRDCAISVGGQTRTWHPGQCLFFDDSFVHEAWNRSSQHRTVLIFDVWHPALTAIERSALTRLFPPIDASFNHRLSQVASN